MYINLINLISTEYLYKIATTNIWTEYLAIFFSDGLILLSIILYVAIIYPLRKKSKYSRTVFHDIAPALTAGFAAYIMKLAFHIERPFVVLGLSPLVSQPDPGASFPSFHAAVFSAFALTLFFHYRKLGIILLTLTPLVLIGRIAIGVHWLTDVLFGSFLGFMIAFKYFFKFHKGNKWTEALVDKYIKINR